MYKKRKLIYLLLALMFALNFANISLADTVENLNKEHKNTNQQMKDKKDEIKAIEKESKDVSRQIIDLDIKLDKATVELTEVEKELENFSNEFYDYFEDKIENNPHYLMVFNAIDFFVNYF